MDFQNSQIHPQCIHSWVEDQAQRTPDAIAVVFGAQQLSYRDLNNQANQLAWRLQKLGVRIETLVGICVERSPQMIISMLAVLKAGGAYIPLDPSYPRERIELMEEDSEITILITEEKLVDSLSSEAAHTPCVDTDK